MFLKKLPTIFQQNNLLTTIGSKLQNKNVIFSALVYREGKKNFIINKTPQTPYFEKDWQCYSLLRCLANSQITTGSTLRSEKDTFKSHFAHKDKNIEQMYRNLKGQGQQNVYVMTNNMLKEQLLPYFDNTLYNVLNQDSLKKKQMFKVGLKDVIQDLKSKKLTPILLQSGSTVIDDYFTLLKQHQGENLIDGGYLAFFQGKLEKPCIGKQFTFHQQAFQSTWNSQSFDVHHKNQNIGKLSFKLYEKKKETKNATK